LYSLINSEYNSRVNSKSTSTGHLKGKDLFDANIWKDEDSTSVFHTFIASLRQRIKEDVKSASGTHKFIRRLRDSKKLVRCYTQNIDGLEAREGLCLDIQRGKGSRSRFTPKSLKFPNHQSHNIPGGILDGGCEIVQLHGDLEQLRCSICQNRPRWNSEHQKVFLRGEAPICDSCEEDNMIRQIAGKRSTAIGTCECFSFLTDHF
jgi:NAD-dependent SIR2 family protein deacetylase